MFFFSKKRKEREWSPDQAILPEVIFDDASTVHIKNIRNITYKKTHVYDVEYYDTTFDLEKIESVWFMLEPFGLFGAAHTLVSFRFSDGQHVSISAEIRKKKGDLFSPITGVLNGYELMYVIADESDILKLRTNYRKNDVYLYPLALTTCETRAMFIDMLMRAKALTTRTEYYHTVVNNCMTNIVAHLHACSDFKLPRYSYRYLLPSRVDYIFHSVGLIDLPVSLQKIREIFFITKKAQKIKKAQNFSEEIRKIYWNY